MRVLHRYLAAIAILTLIALVGGCLNPFGASKDKDETTDAAEPEPLTGILRVVTGAGGIAASTIAPGDDLKDQVHRYRLVLTGVDENAGETLAVDPYTDGAEIELSFGPWTVLLEGYDGSNNLIAEGLIKDGEEYVEDQRIEIGADDNTVTAELRPLTTDGVTGTLDLTVTWPSDLGVTVELFLLRDIVSTDPWTYGGAEGEVASEDYTTSETGLTMTKALYSGYWELELQLVDSSEDPYTTLIEIVHIHDHLTSTGTLDLTEFFPATYAVSFDAGEGEDPTPLSKMVAYGSPYGALATTSRTGYTLAGWNTEPGGGGVQVEPTDEVEIDGDHTLYARWDINQYTLTYTAGVNGTITGTTPQTVNHGGNGTLVTAVPNVGYSFVQWSDGVTTAARTDTNVTGNINVTATFTIDQYTLTYTAGVNGTITGATPQTVNHGGNGTLVTAVPNVGYSFDQWSDGVTTAARTDTNVTGNINVTATFTINQYTLTYTAGVNGTITGTTPQTVNHGGNGTLVTAVPNVGYSFDQWSDGVTTAARTDTNVTGNINVTATFTINQYTVTYHAGLGGTGTVPTATNHDYNSIVTVSDHGELEGPKVAASISQRFLGWNTQEDGSGADYGAGVTFNMPAGNMDLHAQWTTDLSVLGKIGEAGGYVFYDKGNNDDGWRYLETAPADLPETMFWIDESGETPVNNTLSTIGSGHTNTNLIIVKLPLNDSAAKACDEYVFNGFNDWFLPAIDSLEAINTVLQVEGIGGFTTGNYWSSTEAAATTAQQRSFLNQSNANSLKFGNSLRVRPVRRFE